MKVTTGGVFLIFLIVTWFSACAKKDDIVKDTCQGLYEMSHTMHEIEHPDEPVPFDPEYPSYDQYERERKEITGDREKQP